ncbi:uncharacterized protein DDB_G0283357 isoform X1 [Condylostylus longicornis]|uniref:uncharacterized protein DDB_G0283357 isoform X1 n=1 Tax=Condylostylus longicornis TaxID=2530218 RepID=UPI00244E4369|nr:uncharacterized protein DDB_G0283357 isoform X1 [Condylostylus longicornis]
MRKLNVNSAMPRPQRSTPQAKRVPPPAVPTSEMIHHRKDNDGSGNDKNLVSGYSSIEDGGFTQTRDCPAALSAKEEIIEFNTLQSNSGTEIVVGHNKSPNNLNNSSNNPYITPNAFTFPILGHRSGEPLTHKAAVYYHQQLALQEDQGIDLTQSPGRDSPGSSSGSAGSGSRHSTASLDSGRASSYITSSGTASTRGALSSPRCSVSSCSIGSVDRMSQRSDNDIITDWLIDIKFDEYIQLFTAAGYDLPTVARMTPEDLTAIGIKNPQHRERIKQHIDNLQIPDGLPNFVPGSIEEWLRLLRLEEYIQPLLEQNYKTVRDVTQVTWEDLEDIGIVKLGHQKKILLAIKRVKDIISGKWKMKGGNNYQNLPQYYPVPQQQEFSEFLNSSNYMNYQNVYQSRQLQSHNLLESNSRALFKNDTTCCQNVNYVGNSTDTTCNNIYTTPSPTNGVNNKYLQTVLPNSFSNTIRNQTIQDECSNCEEQQQQQQNRNRVSWGDDSLIRKQTVFNDNFNQLINNDESNDVVLIKIRHPRGKSLESLEDLSERNIRTHLTFSHYSTDYTYFPQHMQVHPAQQFQQQHLQMPDISKNVCINPNFPYHLATTQWRRSYDDGDITPTNEISAISGTSIDLIEGGGTLPRQRGGSASARCRLLERSSATPSPVNMTGSGSNDNNMSPGTGNNCGIQGGRNNTQHMISGLNYNCIAPQDNIILMSNSVRYTTGNSPLTSKKPAPEPPRRQCSIRQTGRSASLQEPSSLVPVMASISLQQHSAYFPQQQHLTAGNCALIQQNTNPTSNRNLQPFQQPKNCHLQSQQNQQKPSQQQQQQQQQPIYVNYSNIHQTKAEVHCEQTHDSKSFQSNSSIDSIDTIPFANENTGTIKQRLLNRQEISSSLSLSSSSSSSSSTNTIANIAQSFHSLKSSGSLHETTLHGLISGGGSGGNSGSGNCSSNILNSVNKTNSCAGNIGDIEITNNDAPSPSIPIYSPNEVTSSIGNVGAGTALGVCVDISSISSPPPLSPSSTATAIVPSSVINSALSANISNTNQQQQQQQQQNDSVNVLNDIGNMLANLTDELDAMLEEEKRVGISDSE